MSSINVNPEQEDCRSLPIAGFPTIETRPRTACSNGSTNSACALWRRRNCDNGHSINPKRQPEAAVERAVRLAQVKPDAAGRTAADEQRRRGRIRHVEQTDLVADLGGEQTAKIGEILRRAGQLGLAQLRKLAGAR